MAKWVYSFGDGKAEGQSSMRNLLGGKGANLAEMSNLGLPVPPGFTITTEVCSWYYDNDRQYPAELKAEVQAALDAVGALTGRGFGDPKNPLLVSVRSGARASMPGMMDTVLNLGLNDTTVEALAEGSGDPRFAYDSYRRFITMYSNVVLDVEHHAFEEALEHYKETKGFSLDTELGAEDWKHMIGLYKKIVRDEHGADFPQGAEDQLWGAIGAVFSSWMIPRAKKYRELNGIPESWGTAVNVQAMVFGNMGDTSATGVAFTRNPSTGERALYGEFLINAQGEDVVAGIRTPQDITEKARIEAKSDKPSMERAMPESYAELVRIYGLLETHYRDMQDMEFTIESGKLWMLQTRNGKRTAKAALRIAVDLAAEGLITEEEAIGRVEPAALDQLLHPTIDPESRAQDHRVRPAGIARRGHRRDRVQFRGCRGRPQGRAQVYSRADRDEPRGHPRDARLRGYPHHARRHDLARRRGRPRHGQALRLGRRHDPRRLQGRHPHGGGHDAEGRRQDHHRRLHRPGPPRRSEDAGAVALPVNSRP